MPPTFPSPTYAALYAFGDSLSDAGNLSVLTAIAGSEPVSPPYYEARYGLVGASVFSNGPVWTQNLSVSLGLGTLAPSLLGGTDFAYGGAETGGTPQNANDPKLAAIALPSQLGQYEAFRPFPAPNALYTLSIGSNDMLDILANPGLSLAQQVADVAAAVANEIHFVNELVADGARHLLVLDVPDLGRTPDVISGRADGGPASAALVAEASRLARDYNASLVNQLAAIARGGAIDIRVIDAYPLIDDAVANPSAYGLTNATSPVWGGNYTDAGSGTLAATGAAQNQYLFFDQLHPTETGQRVLAAEAVRQLDGTSAILPLNAAVTVSLPNQTLRFGGGASGAIVRAAGTRVFGDAGADTIVDDGPGTTINLGTGATTVNVLSGGPVVYGDALSGPLFFSGGAGAATVAAGAGATTVFANAGGGQFFGGAAASMLFVGGSGASTAVGGAGRSTLFGGGGMHDLLIAGTGPSTVVGGGGGAVVVGLGAAGDVLIAGGGAETLVGSAGGGNDLLFAGTGPDALFAGTGNDTLVAAPGDAQLFAGAAAGAGATEFLFSNGAAGGAYALWNFQPGRDHVALFGYASNGLETAFVGSGSTTITLSDNSRITFANVANLTASAFA